jgi:hypothetical protein
MLKDRLLELIEMEGLNNNQFYKKTGLGIGFLDKVGEKLKRPSVEKISTSFPHWNVDYLQTGEGERLKNEQNLEHVKNSIAIGRDANGSEIHVTSQNVEEFIRITEKYQEHTDKMLAIIEKLINK